jgi:hypothetical protein
MNDRSLKKNTNSGLNSSNISRVEDRPLFGYFDVYSTVEVLTNPGIPRVVKGLFAELRKRGVALTPVVWSFSNRDYSNLVFWERWRLFRRCLQWHRQAREPDVKRELPWLPRKFRQLYQRWTRVRVQWLT